MEGATRIRAIAHDLARRVLAANLLVNAVSIAAGVVAGVTIHKLPDGTSPIGPMLLIFAASVPYFGVWAAVSWALSTARLRPALAWMEEGRSASIGETVALVRQPWRQSQVMFCAWLTGAPLLALDVGRYVAWPLAVASGALFVVAGTVALTVSRINVEAALRPVLAQALDRQTLSTHSTAGLLSRLLGSWMFGSAAYLLGVIVTLLASKPSHVDMTYTAAAIAAIGLIVGAATTVRSAIGVSNRVAALHEAQRQVEAGDLQTRVDVDDAGELGRLQAGFNRMVDGLVQRRLLEDLFGRHVGVDVARRAVLGGGGLRGEERIVSVLFVDVVASTALTQRMAPGKVIELLNLFFTEVIECAAQHGGWVNKFEGDGALCIFGAPEELADHAASALRAAADLRARLDVLGEREPALRASIGVSTGPAVAGNVGSENRYEYTVIGDAVNEAARLTEVAKTKPGMLLASKRAVDAAGDAAACWGVERKVRLRGHETQTVAYGLAD